VVYQQPYYNSYYNPYYNPYYRPEYQPNSFLDYLRWLFGYPPLQN
jgi:hypothetical protein